MGLFKKSVKIEMDSEEEIQKKAAKEQKKTNREILFVTYIFVAIFLALIIYLVKFMFLDSEKIINNSYNTRSVIFEERIVRGSILSRNMEVLATTNVSEDGKEQRNYPFGRLFAHVVGYCARGNIGVEACANFKLLSSNDYLKNRIRNDLNNKKNKGDSVVTTLDVDLQRAAYDAMGGNTGAVVVMNCKTGEILAMVSKPDFDPNDLINVWEDINEDSGNSILLNRATQGLYPPGSTFKIVTGLEYMKEYPESVDLYEFNCSGSFTNEDDVINCFHGQQHGALDFKHSFAKSCNSSFASISTLLDKEKFAATCGELLFNSDLPIPFTYKKSYVDINSDTPTEDIMQVGIGQGKTQITPVHMAMITAAVANDGVLMQPYVISQVLNCNNNVVKSYSAKEYGRLVSKNNAMVLRDYMREVVVSGTATKLNSASTYTASGKTGSAEYSTDKSKSHAWFTGFAPSDDPELVVTVIAEGAGSGGDVAVPIAKAVFDEYFCYSSDSDR